MFLHVLEDNAPALGLYQSLGFTAATRVPRFYDVVGDGPGESGRGGRIGGSIHDVCRVWEGAYFGGESAAAQSGDC